MRKPARGIVLPVCGVTRRDSVLRSNVRIALEVSFFVLYMIITRFFTNIMIYNDEHFRTIECGDRERIERNMRAVCAWKVERSPRCHGVRQCLFTRSLQSRARIGDSRRLRCVSRERRRCDRRGGVQTVCAGREARVIIFIIFIHNMTEYYIQI